MSPNLDDNATTRESRLTEHAARLTFLTAVRNTIDLGGLPAPATIGFNPDRRQVRLVMDENGTADVDDWAAQLGITATRRPLEVFGWHRYFADQPDDATWHGYQVSVSCVIKRAGGA